LKYWSGPRVEAEESDGKERGRRIPIVGCNDQATRPAAPLPRARRVAPILALAGVARWAEIAADIGAALAPWPAPKSTATRSIPVFQQSLRRLHETKLARKTPTSQNSPFAALVAMVFVARLKRPVQCLVVEGLASRPHELRAYSERTQADRRKS
jgi:hypothetical protein